MSHVLSAEKVADIQGLISEGLATFAISKRLLVSRGSIDRVRAGRHPQQTGGIIRKRPKARKHNTPIRYVPTPEEIERQCFKFRMQKPEPEAEPWTPPAVFGLIE